MSVECYSDRLCCQAHGIQPGNSPESMTEILSAESSPGEDTISGFINDEQDFVIGDGYVDRFRTQSLDATARAESIAWILKVKEIYKFQPLTAYLSVNYFDRFLYSGCLVQRNGWPIQLLSIACLSLAAKMEEPLVPSLLDLQVEGASYMFEPQTICRMELLVLSVLDWRLQSITPFSFIHFFASKVDCTGKYVGSLVSRATDIILCNIKEISFCEYRPSCIAAATVLCAARGIPNLGLLKPEHAESWCDGLRKDKIISCYRLLQKFGYENRWRRNPDVIPQLRVTVQAIMPTRVSSRSLSPLSSSRHKKRKLNNCTLPDDDKENLQQRENK